MVEEKRKHPRQLAETVVSYRSRGPTLLAPDQGEGVIENVSLGGIFLHTEEPLPEGTEVDLEFDVGEGNRFESVRARGVVKWNRTKFPPFGMGVEFTNFDSGRQALEHWLKLMAQHR